MFYVRGTCGPDMYMVGIPGGSSLPFKASALWEVQGTSCRKQGQGVSSSTWDRFCFLPWGVAILTGLVIVDTPFRFCGDKEHHTVRKTMWWPQRDHGATPMGTPHLCAVVMGAQKPGDCVAGATPLRLQLAPSQPALCQAAHLQRLLKLGREGLCPGRRA